MTPRCYFSALGIFCLVLGLLTLGCSRQKTAATYTVVARPFVQRVTAEGILAAGTVTSVTVPDATRNSVRITWLAEDASLVLSGEPVARFDAGAFSQSLADGLSALSSASFRSDETQSNSTAEQAGLITQLELSQLEILLAQQFGENEEGVSSRHELLTSRIDEQLATDRQLHAEAKTSTQQKRTDSELKILDIEQREARFEIDEAEAGLASLEVLAPHDGLFTRAMDWRGKRLEIGQELWNGRPVGEIPDLNTLEAKVFVLEADAGGVIEGLEADVTVEAHPETTHQATVSRVHSIAQPRKNGSPVQYFEVTLTFEETELSTMKPGQRVVATLYLAQKEKALMVPRQAVRRHGEGHRVFIQKGSTWVPRSVALGVGSRSLVEISSGIKEGESIVMQPPEESDSDALPSQESSDEGQVSDD